MSCFWSLKKKIKHFGNTFCVILNSKKYMLCKKLSGRVMSYAKKLPLKHLGFFENIFPKYAIRQQNTYIIDALGGIVS